MFQVRDAEILVSKKPRLALLTKVNIERELYIA
jgi:hypothetical protein